MGWASGCGPTGTYRADSAYGQYVLVRPDRQGVVTVTAHSERDDELLEAAYELVLNRL